MFKTGHIPAHAGKITTTDPIRGDDIKSIRNVLTKPRDIALWSVGTNCALRAGDLLSLKWDDTTDDGERITIVLKESKTQKLRRIVLNAMASADLRTWRRESNSEFCFSGQRGQLTVAALGRMIKHWAALANVDAKRVSSHSLRKTWCRAMVEQFDEPLYRMMWALGHSSERQTAQYIGLLTDEVAGLYQHIV